MQSLSAIIQEDPEPVGALSPQTPAPVRWIVERCLAKDPEDRYASTRDLARELQSVRDHFSDLGSSMDTSLSGVAPTLPRSAAFHRKWKWSYILPWLLIAVFGTLLASQMLRGQTKAMTRSMQKSMEMSLPRGHQLAPSGALAFAPDGSAIVFCLVHSSLKLQLWLRRLDQFELIPLEGTQGGTYPFWSPDSKSIAFFVDSLNLLRRLEIATGITQTICKRFPF